MEEAQQTLRRPQNFNREFTHVISEDHPKMNLITEFRACVLLEESRFAFVWIGLRASKIWRYVIYKCISNHESRDKMVLLNFNRKVNLINALQ